MKNLSFLFCLVLFIAFGVYVDNRIIDLESKKIPSFTTEIKTLKNVQRRQEERTEQLATIQQLSFILHSTELSNKELANFLGDAIEENNLLKFDLQRASDFINGLLRENEALKTQLQ